MKKYHFLSILLLLFPLVSCNSNGNNSSSNNGGTSNSSNNNESSLISENDESSEGSSSTIDDDSSENNSSDGDEDSSEGDSSSTGGSDSGDSSFTSSSSDEEISGNNPDGSPRISRPSNINSPLVITDDYHNFSCVDSLTGDFSLIYGNDKYENPGYSKFEHNGNNPDVNGLKMDYFDKYHTGRSYIGLQSPAIVPCRKIEFRIRVSATHGTQKKDAKKNKPVFTIYGFSKAGELVHTSTYYGCKQSDEDLKYVDIFKNPNPKFYIENDANVFYFEFRLNQAPFQNAQEFNFNINQLTLKGYNY